MLSSKFTSLSSIMVHFYNSSPRELKTMSSSFSLFRLRVHLNYIYLKQSENDAFKNIFLYPSVPMYVCAHVYVDALRGQQRLSDP